MDLMRSRNATHTEIGNALRQIVRAYVDPESVHPLVTIHDIDLILSSELKKKRPDLQYCIKLCDKAVELYGELFNINIGRINTETLSMVTDGAADHRKLSRALTKVANGAELDRSDLSSFDQGTETKLVELAASAAATRRP